MTFGNKIKILRKKFKITQSELAKALDVSTGAVGLWEINRREPDTITLIKLAKFFNVSVDYLLDNEIDNNITIIGADGSYKKFVLSEGEIEAITKLVATMENKEDK